MNKKPVKLIIFGIGDLAKTLYSYIYNSVDYEIVAFCVDDEYKNTEFFCGLKIIEFSALLKKYSVNDYKILLAVGYSNMRLRKLVFEKIKISGFEFINYVHDTAVIHDSVKMEEGNIFFPNVVVEPSTTIGSNNIFWSSVNVCHDVSIGSHNFFASQVLLGGFSFLGNLNFIGFNATVLQSVKIENEVLLGAKSLLLKNADSFGKYIGSPAVLASSHAAEGIRIK